MIMDMGAASTKLYIVERGIIRASHTVNRGGQDITSTISKSLGLPIADAEVLKREKGAMSEDKNLVEIIGLGPRLSDAVLRAIGGLHPGRTAH
jgi:cell division ATPase FtsA